MGLKARCFIFVFLNWIMVQKSKLSPKMPVATTLDENFLLARHLVAPTVTCNRSWGRAHAVVCTRAGCKYCLLAHRPVAILVAIMPKARRTATASWPKTLAQGKQAKQASNKRYFVSAASGSIPQGFKQLLLIAFVSRSLVICSVIDSNRSSFAFPPQITPRSNAWSHSVARLRVLFH
jgi:hypothetical protein